MFKFESGDGNVKILNDKISLTILEGQSGEDDEENTPSQPDRIKPMQKTVRGQEIFTVYHNSFVVAQMTLVQESKEKYSM